MIKTSEGFNTRATSDKNKTLLGEKAKLAKALIEHKGITPISFNKSANHIKVPVIKGYHYGFLLTLGDTDCLYKKLIFAAINAAHHRYFTSDDFAQGRKAIFCFAKPFWTFVQSSHIKTKNKANILKEFESYRTRVDNVKTQSSGLSKIKLLIKDALAFSDFRQSLEDWEADYLFGITEVAIAPPDEKDAINLSHWFSSHTWLRRADVGIGNALYARLTSPKALMGSFRVTIETALIEIQSAKDALVAFFRETQFTSAELPYLKSSEAFEVDNLSKANPSVTRRAFFNTLHEKLATQTELTPALHFAIELIVFSNIQERFRDDVLTSVLGKKEMIWQKNCFITKCHSVFHLSWLSELVSYAETPKNVNEPMPVCETEQLYFNWLMAYQTVQSSDIAKLTLRNFKFIKRVNGHITHIESDYWKGRANTSHQVKTLKTSDDMGKAVLRYISDVTALQNQDISLTSKKSPSYRFSGHGLIGWSVMLCLNTSLRTILDKKYQTHKLTPVFIESFAALISKGLTKLLSERRCINDCNTIVKDFFFGLSSIKTSAIYAQSDTFDPTTLVNYNSHNDNTELKSYLTSQNEEWQNNCGKITRAVMRDLSVNLFRASQRDREIFNSEFTHAVELIEARSQEVLASMKIVTQKQSGRVDELGMLQNTHLEGDLPDSIYLQDSPETVMKLLHYLEQVEQKHIMLKHSSTEFLFFTVLPTSEWIETLFEQKSFEKDSLLQGEALFEKYKAQLPPLFTAQLA